MTRTVVTYFSVEGNTKKLGDRLASLIDADIFEIVPEKPYSKADIRWTNPLARCNREKIRNKDVPVKGIIDVSSYDVIVVGFPIWYGCAPNVVNTFLKQLDLTGKKIKVFVTSRGSGIGKTAEKLQPYAGKGTIVDATLLQNSISDEELEQWGTTIA